MQIPAGPTTTYEIIPDDKSFFCVELRLSMKRGHEEPKTQINVRSMAGADIRAGLTLWGRTNVPHGKKPVKPLPLFNSRIRNNRRLPDNIFIQQSCFKVTHTVEYSERLSTKGYLDNHTHLPPLVYIHTHSTYFCDSSLARN